MYTLNKSNLNIGVINYKSAGGNEELYIGHKCTAANNGKVLIEVTRPEIKEEEFPQIDGIQPLQVNTAVVSSRAAIKISKKIPKSINPVLNQAIVSQNGSLKIASTDLMTQNCDMIEDKKTRYPDYKQVMPNENDRKHRIAIDPAYLEQVAKLAKEFQREQNSDEQDCRMYIDFYGEGSAITLQTRNVRTRQNFKAIIMPLNQASRVEELDRETTLDN